MISVRSLSRLFIVSVVAGVLTILTVKSIKYVRKTDCLKRLLKDIENQRIKSYYDISGFRCKYESMYSSIFELQDRVEQEIKKDRLTFANVLPGIYRLAYTPIKKDEKFDKLFCKNEC